MPAKNPNGHPKVVTVRMSHELHARLVDLAWRQRQSLNSLCVELLQKPFVPHKPCDNSPGNPTPCSPTTSVHPERIQLG